MQVLFTRSSCELIKTSATTQLEKLTNKVDLIKMR